MMTAAARDWAWSQRIPRRGGAQVSARCVLLFLSERADKAGTCWPSVDAIADATGLTARAVVDVLHWLADLGMVEIERRHDADGRRKSNLYRLRLRELASPSKVNPVHVGLSEPSAGLSEPSAGLSELASPESIQEPFKNPSGGRARKRATPPPERIEVTDSLLTLGQSLGLDRLTVEHELAACLDWHRANGKARVDWLATARNWLRKAKQLNGSRRAAPSAADFRFPRPDDSGAWETLAARHGVESKPGEDWPSYQARIRRAIEAGRAQR
jgi:hypothetical protein